MSLAEQIEKDVIVAMKAKDAVKVSTLRMLKSALGNYLIQVKKDKAGDPELLYAMRQCGINMIAIGYESPIEEELKAMNKRINPADMLALTRMYHKAGFLIHGMFIFGYPMPEGASFRMSAQERIKRFRAFIDQASLR